MESEITDTDVGEMDGGGYSECVQKMNQFQLCTNPLELPPVIRCVFKYLDIKNAINLRLVSKEWSSVGLSVLANRSVDFFLPGKLSKFYQAFSSSFCQRIGFKNVTFSGVGQTGLQKPWYVDELNEFFKDQGHHITKLKLKRIQLMECCSKTVSDFSITPWISNCAMTKQKTKDNTKLSVCSVNCDRYIPNFIVDSSCLAFINELTLRDVRVNIQQGILLTPTKLNLQGVSFFKDGNKLSHLHLNEIFDFSKTKDISLYSYVNTKLSLELNGCGKLENLLLVDAKLTNFRRCRWEVDKLTVMGAAFENTEMPIKELHVGLCESLDISNIPSSLEKMTVNHVEENTFAFSQRVVLHNIKFLHLTFCSNVISLFTEYLTFPNLTHIHLGNYLDDDLDMELDLARLPKSIKVMSLSKIKIYNSGKDTFKVERLILTPSDLFNMNEFCASSIRTKNLVLDFLKWDGEYEGKMQQILEILEHQRICKQCVLKIFVATWDSNTFDTSYPLYNYVDQKSAFYLFENQKGKSITLEEFSCLTDLNIIYSESKY